MNVVFRPASPEVKTAFAQGLSQAAYLEGKYSPKHDYHVVGYSLSLKHLEAIPDGGSIDHVVKPVGWQCFAASVEEPEHAGVVGEVMPVYKAPRQSGEFAGPLRMTSLAYGEVVNDGYKRALRMHKECERIPGGDYEPRMLRIPGLLITAFWMKSIAKPPQEDLIVPIHHMLPALSEPYYPVSVFLQRVQPLAKERLNNTVQEEPSA